MEAPHRFGVVALIGRPNVGKSTLTNALVGQKVAIVSNKKQTTRRRLTGILTEPGYQVVFVDTPGIHEPHTRLGRAMVESTRGALEGLDAVVVVVEGHRKPDTEDERIARLLADSGFESGERVLLAMNKMDLLKPEFVLPHTEAYQRMYRVSPELTMLTTATKGHNVDRLLDLIVSRLPEGPAAYPEDTLTDQSSRFMVAELVRERVLNLTRQEVPHATGVVVDSWEETEDLLRIHATIYVERPGQRAILLGQKGASIKRIGTEARREVEDLLGRHVYLELFVKVREGWRQNPETLREMEYME